MHSLTVIMGNLCYRLYFTLCKHLHYRWKYCNCYDVIMSEISIEPKRNMYNETKIEESFKFKYFTALL